MEAPVDVVTSLKNVRPTFELRYNHKGKVVSERSFDANGKARELEYEPRWELWDIDANNEEYRVCVLQGENGDYRPPDQRIVELIRLINPERYGGDLSKMIEALVDEPNNYLENMDTQAFEDLVEYLADRTWSAKTPHIAVPRSVVPVRG